ncbi:hypothetical protein A1019T_02475 [Psychrobacter pasteurii]|uniref:Uncharacterized protein n=1 Tax=Psychrobacter pasteurii TaxID=1945520 RepID=A0A1R4EJ25_9GAMM|nr:hypothetical protein A1019T_02475 [Psychrobacter pasteurii]
MENKLTAHSTITSEDMFAINNILNDYRNLSNAIEVILGMPEDIGIANNLYNHEQCSELQRKNNLVFLEDAKATSVQYIQQSFSFDTDYFLKDIDKFSNGYNESGFAGNKDEYALNKYIGELFNIIAINLNEILSNSSEFNHILSKYPSSEAQRLSLKFLEVFRLYAFKELSFIAYHIKSFNIALMYHDYAMQLYFSSSKSIFYDSADYFRKISSIQGVKAAKARWSDQRKYRQQKKKEYLKIKKDQGFKKNTDAANYIIENTNSEEELNYDYVYRLLCEATNGNFD